MATATKTRISADEFLAMDLGEGLFELVRGEVVELPVPGPEHGIVCANTAVALHTFGRRTGHGYAISNDSAVRISDDTVRGGDVIYYSEARWPRANLGPAPAPIPPDLVVEVISPSDRTSQVLDKVRDYLFTGVLMVWVLHPRRRTLTIYVADDPTPRVLPESESVEGLPELPGFRCQVAEFFA